MGNNYLKPNKSCLHCIFVLKTAQKPIGNYSFVEIVFKSMSRFLKQKKLINTNKRRKKEKKPLFKIQQELHTLCKGSKNSDQVCKALKNENENGRYLAMEQNIRQKKEVGIEIDKYLSLGNSLRSNDI